MKSLIRNGWMAAVVAAAAVLAGCGEFGDGNVVTETREVSGFDAVRNETFLDVHVQQAEAEAVEVTIDENLHDRVIVKVADGTLVIDNRPIATLDWNWFARVDVRMPRIRSAASNGSGKITVSGFDSADRIELSSDGSGGLDFDGSAPELDVLSDGSGNMHLKGSARRIRIVSDGSGLVDARSVEAESADLLCDGSGSVYATVRGGSLDAEVRGSGDIHWWGEASASTIVDDGSGSIQHRN